MTTSDRAWEKLAAGEVWRGWHSPGKDLPDLPVLAARGRSDGPTLLITAGVHGDEYEGPAATWRFFDELDLTTLQGRVIAIPVANGAAWQARARHTPADGGDLNRCFGQPATDRPTTRLAQLLYDEFVRACDVLVDLHSGGVRLVHLPLIGWYRGGIEAERLARRFDGALHPWLIPDVPGVLSYEAHRLGKAALGAEWQGGAALDPAGAAAYARGLSRLWRLVTHGGSAADEADNRVAISGRYQETEIGGLFQPSVKLGQRVEKGDRLGLLRNELGAVVATPTAFQSGMVVGLSHLPLLFPGDRIAYIG